MKKEYKVLELETVTFDDIITASGGCDCDCPTVKVVAPCPDECECNGNVAICEYQCNVAF